MLLSMDAFLLSYENTLRLSISTGLLILFLVAGWVWPRRKAIPDGALRIASNLALAVANTGLLRLLRSGSQYVDRIAAVLVLLSGVYLVYYFWVVDVNEDRSAITDRIERLQQRIQAQLLDHWQPVALVLFAVVAVAAIYALGRRRPDAEAP